MDPSGLGSSSAVPLSSCLVPFLPSSVSHPPSLFNPLPISEREREGRASRINENLQQILSFLGPSAYLCGLGGGWGGDSYSRKRN